MPLVCATFFFNCTESSRFDDTVIKGVHVKVDCCQVLRFW